MVEFERLTFIRNNQSKLKVEKYKNLYQPSTTEENQDPSKGKRLMLSSTFVGSYRFVD